jgi:predicted nucleic acid-binding protein
MGISKLDEILAEILVECIADEPDIDHIFAFDSDFRTLGFSLVPGDVAPPDR